MGVFFLFRRGVSLAVEYNRSVFYKCFGCGEEGALACPNCGENDTFSLEAEFAGCDCGQDIDELKCDCGQLIYGDSFYLDGNAKPEPKETSDNKKPEKKQQETDSKRNWDKLLFSVLYLLNWKRILLYSLLVFTVLKVIDYATLHPDQKFRDASKGIVKTGIGDPKSFKHISTDIVWRDSQNGHYIARTVYEYKSAGQKKVRECRMTAFSYEGIEYKWNQLVGIKKCDYSRRITEAEIMQMIELNSFGKFYAK